MMNTPEHHSCVDRLHSLEPFIELHHSSLTALDRHCETRPVSANDLVFTEGQADHHHIYLLEGELELSSEYRNSQHSVLAGSAEARHALAHAQPRQATARAIVDSLVLLVDNDALDRQLTWEQLLGYGNLGLQNNNAWATKLRPTWELPAANVIQLFQHLDRLEVESGDIIINQGDAGDYFYIIESGKALVSRELNEGDGESIELAELGAGDGFGEEALLSGNPRNATVSMITDGALRRLSKEHFQILLVAPELNLRTAREAQNLVKAGARWLDVRYPGEYRASRLPNAINIPLHELKTRVGELDPTTLYLCYCDSGRRSSVAEMILTQRGYQAATLDEGTDHLPYPG
ncbi:MAG: cyclic nucleotide-binding domain-containing protein [Gammaproteobacteria bacterium]|nr:cyclic nucleotide-binding domain-containing protein [Gammaproteobacteria bacterium]